MCKVIPPIITQFLIKIKKLENEKWVNPSLQANSKQNITIPTDGYLLIKNFNPNSLTIQYQIND
jgi:hypothetical protein